MTHYNFFDNLFDMTPAKGAAITSVGGALGVIKGMITTGQFGDAFILGAATASGALLISVLAWIAKKVPKWSKQIKDWIWAE